MISTDRQLKIGAIISYMNVALNMAISIFLTPFLISSLGVSEYGVYRIVQSFAGQLTIASFGIASLVTRNIVFFNTTNDQKKKENFLFFAKIITFSLTGIIVIIGVVMYSLLEPMYSKSFTQEEMKIAKQLFVFLIATMGFNLICDSYLGIATAHEKFIFTKALHSIKLIFRVVLIFSLCSFGVKSIAIVATDCFIAFITMIIVILYNKIYLKEKAKYYFFDKPLLIQSLSFSFAIFLQTIINQVNQNLDNVILGAMTDSKTVTLYSTALSLFVTYSSLVTTVGTLFGPKATKLVAKNASPEELTDFVARTGRIQFMIAGLIIGGFVLFGKNFIMIWVGKDFLPIYPIVIALFIPATIPFVETTTEALLNAKMKRLGRSLILIAMCLVNLVVSILLTKKIGYWGATIGTGFSFVFGYGVLINIYLNKTLGLKIIRLFKNVLKGTLFGGIISMIIGSMLTLLPDNLVCFCLKVVLYTMIYTFVIYLVSANEEEKNLIKGLLKWKRKN